MNNLLGALDRVDNNAYVIKQLVIENFLLREKIERLENNLIIFSEALEENLKITKKLLEV